MNRPKTQKDYRKRRHLRIRTRMTGDAKKPRLVVFRSLRYTYAQLVDDQSGKILMAAHDMSAGKTTGSKKTDSKEKSKVDRAMEVGKELAEKAKQSGISTCVFDRNGYKYHGRVKAVAEGAREGGLTL